MEDKSKTHWIRSDHFAEDGGDIESVEYTDDNIVKVRLQGHCAGCPGSSDDDQRCSRKDL